MSTKFTEEKLELAIIELLEVEVQTENIFCTRSSRVSDASVKNFVIFTVFSSL